MGLERPAFIIWLTLLKILIFGKNAWNKNCSPRNFSYNYTFQRVPHPTPLEGADPDSDEEPDNPEEAEREFFHTQFHVRRNQVPVLTGTRKEELLKIREIFKKMIDKFGST